MKYTADNMSRFLGNDATDNDAKRYAAYLESQGWELVESEVIRAYRDGRFWMKNK